MPNSAAVHMKYLDITAKLACKDSKIKKQRPTFGHITSQKTKPTSTTHQKKGFLSITYHLLLSPICCERAKSCTASGLQTACRIAAPTTALRLTCYWEKVFFQIGLSFRTGSGLLAESRDARDALYNETCCLMQVEKKQYRVPLFFLPPEVTSEVN